MKYQIKLITGFRQDQEHTVDAEEAHKAYYLFRNPEKRGVFNNGLALIGSDIKQILPDYHGTMGWNPTHKLDDDDWAEIRGRGVDRKLRDMLHMGDEVAKLGEQKISLSLTEASKDLPQIQISDEVKQLSDKFKA